MLTRILAAAAVSLCGCAAAAAQGQGASDQPASSRRVDDPGRDARPPQAPDRRFRGAIVCEKMPSSPDILRIPLDVTVRDGAVVMARPIMNWNGSRVLGTEIGMGAIDPDGKVRLTSMWSSGGVTYTTDYTGSLAQRGGTLTGTQSWTGRESGSRSCVGALVPAPQPAEPEEDED